MGPGFYEKNIIIIIILLINISHSLRFPCNDLTLGYTTY